MDNQLNFSFAGCGFLGIYHVGVATCLKKYAPELLVNKISGASAGSLAAVALLCDSPLGIITSSILKTATEARKYLMGPFHPTFNVEQLLRDGLLKVLPDNAHEIVSGRIFISVTRVSDGKNVLLSQFDTREELVQALLCSAFIPTFSGWTSPIIKGVRYVDGGFSDNLPQIDEKTVTVSPFCGEADICPKDNNAGLVTINLANTSLELTQENLYRFTKILFPPNPETLSRMCQQGFEDALDFLQRNCLINCTRCMSVQSTFPAEEGKITDETSNVKAHVHDRSHANRNEFGCIDCENQRREAILDSLPDTVGSIFRETMEKANLGLVSWVLKMKSVRMISLMTLPFRFPMEVAYAVMIKCMNIISHIGNVFILAQELLSIGQLLIRTWLETSFSISLIPTKPHRHHDKAFECQIRITEFSGDPEIPRQTVTVPMDDEIDGSVFIRNVRNSISLDADALDHLALTCAAKSISRRNSLAPSRSVSRAVSRRPSADTSSLASFDQNDAMEMFRTEDAFENIVSVTSNQEAIMAYYYLDDDNKMKVTEIFDLTSAVLDNAEEEYSQAMREADISSHFESVADDITHIKKRSPSESSEAPSDPEADRYYGSED